VVSATTERRTRSVGGGATSGEQSGPRWGQIRLSFPRIRTRSDYRDINALIPGGRQPYHAVEVKQALTTIVSGTLALFEGLIAHSSGPEVLGDAARAFVKQVGTPGAAARP
jgi:hypothetical protein